MRVMLYLIPSVFIWGACKTTVREGANQGDDQPAASTCDVEGLTELTDPDALALEQGTPVNTRKLQAVMKTALVCLQQKVQSANGTSRLTSAYRPPQYQNHFQELWIKQKTLKTYESNGPCGTLRAVVDADYLRHGLGASTVMPGFSKSLHTQGLAFDMYINLPANTPKDQDKLAEECLVKRPLPGDPPHHTQ